MKADECRKVVKAKTKVLAIMSIISFLGYFFVFLIFSRLSHWEDLETWLFNIIRHEISDAMLPMAYSLIMIRVIGSGIFLVIMLYFNTRLKSKKSISIIPYFLPMIIVMSHAISWLGIGSVSIGWLLSFPISLLAISTVLSLLRGKGIENHIKSTKVFIGAIIVSFVIWLYMFRVDMRLINRDDLPRFAMSQVVAVPDLYAHRGIGWSAWPLTMDIMCHMVQEDCSGYMIVFWSIISIVLILGIYFFILFIIIKVTGKLLKLLS